MFFSPYFFSSFCTFFLVPFLAGSEAVAAIWAVLLWMVAVNGKLTMPSSGSATWSAASSASMLSSLGMLLRISFKPAKFKYKSKFVYVS